MLHRLYRAHGGRLLDACYRSPCNFVLGIIGYVFFSYVCGAAELNWAVPFFYSYRDMEGKFPGGVPGAFSQGSRGLRLSA